MNDTGKARTVAEILSDIQDARIDLETRSRALAEARNLHTRALNTLNAFQRELDLAVDALKKAAPPGTDWASERERRLPDLAKG